jgi:uncharacterized protein (TIGR02646 family)
MHLLKRGPAPTCLENYKHNTHQWNLDSPTHEERIEICVELEAMQGRRCAYCEGDLDVHGQHIEHFRQRSRYPQGTFAWDNLFLSCLREESCGKHKDQCGFYSPGDLIKPDIEDPEHFFLFASNGTIAIRTASLTPAEQHRAAETLRILNLDEVRGPLRHLRQAHCAGYLQTAEELQTIAATWPQEYWLPFLEEEIAKTSHLPFCTAIKHTLTRTA